MIIFVGDKPSKKMKPGAEPFEGAACEKRLLEWIEIVRTLPTWKVLNQSSPAFESNLFGFMEYSSLVVALGNKASKALDKQMIPHFKLPHPSGRNRQINDKEFIRKKLAECRKWLKSQGE